MWSLSSTKCVIIIIPRSHYSADHITFVLRERKMVYKGGDGERTDITDKAGV